MPRCTYPQVRDRPSYTTRGSAVTTCQIPKAAIAKPDRILINRSRSGWSLAPSQLAPALRSTHQNAEPRNTPVTNHTAAAEPDRSIVIPIPAKIPRNDKIVAGFAIVSRNVVAYAPWWDPREPASAAADAGRASASLTPKKTRKAPPTNWTVERCSSSNWVTVVSPSAAMSP